MSFKNSKTISLIASTTTTTVNYDVYDCTSGTFTIVLMTAVGQTGRTYILKNSGAGTITLNTTSSQTIDGNASGTLTLTAGAKMTVISDGTNWIIG